MVFSVRVAHLFLFFVCFILVTLCSLLSVSVFFHVGFRHLYLIYDRQQHDIVTDMVLPTSPSTEFFGRENRFRLINMVKGLHSSEEEITFSINFSIKSFYHGLSYLYISLGTSQFSSHPCRFLFNSFFRPNFNQYSKLIASFSFQRLASYTSLKLRTIGLKNFGWM